MIKPEKIILPNGMTLILVEAHHSPVVAFNACFRVGSVVESNDEAGLCHYIEHLIFKGTPKRPAGQIAAAIEASGGEINAYTSFDETVYYCTVSSRYFDEGLDILSDAILNPLFDAEEMAREKPVIIEEINRSQDTPGKVLSENLFKTAYQHHPYGRPIIGSKETVNSFTRDTVAEFYKRWYIPQNLVFVISGDFNPEEAKQKVSKIFSNYQSQSVPQVKIPVEPDQNEARSVLIHRPIEGRYVQMAFPIPSLQHSDLPALDILSHLLGEGISSRLEQRIKEKKGLVDSIYTYAYTPKYPGLFVIGFTTAEKKIIKAAQEILKEIFNLEHDRISHEELSRARINIKSDAWYERETVEGLARKYGYFETILSDYGFDRKYYQKIDEVDPDDIHEVAKKYFKPQSLNLALLGAESKILTPETFSPEIILSAIKSKKQKNIPSKSKKEVLVKKLKNGVTLVLKESPHLPLASVRMVNFGGVRKETSANNGIHHFLAQTLTKGTQNRSAEQLALEIEQIAGSIDAFSGRNLDGVQGDFLSEKLDTGLDLLTDVFLNPSFHKNEIEKERRVTLEAIRREQDQLSTLVYKKFLSMLYPSHPYGLPLIGRQETVQNFSQKDLILSHQQMIHPKTMVVSMVGDFDSDRIEDYFNQKLSHLKSKTHKEAPLKEPKAPQEILKHVEKKSKMQTHIALGFLGTKITSTDRHAMDVLNNILSGQGGRLFIELRDKQSLAYTVTSYAQEGMERGFFSVYIATEPQKVDQAIEGILLQLKNIRENLVNTDELDRAKKYLIGSYEIDLQRNSSVATHLAFNQIYGMGADEWKRLPEKVSKVTRQDILEVAQKYLLLDSYVLSIVGG
ncbi:MAG: insulinase family protein [Deltaproteobacteria bacterium]|nr:insulinase family protein [Deltaproteobacteria bacterium]